MTIIEGVLLIGLVVMGGVVFQLSLYAMDLGKRVAGFHKSFADVFKMATLLQETEEIYTKEQYDMIFDALEMEKSRTAYLESLFDQIGLDPDERRSLGDVEDIAAAIRDAIR